MLCRSWWQEYYADHNGRNIMQIMVVDIFRRWSWSHLSTSRIKMWHFSVQPNWETSCWPAWESGGWARPVDNHLQDFVDHILDVADHVQDVADHLQHVADGADARGSCWWMMILTKELLLWRRSAGARGWLWGGGHQAETCSRLPGSPSTHQTDYWARSHHKIIIRVISETGQLQSGHANIFLEKLEDSLKAV